MKKFVVLVLSAIFLFSVLSISTTEVHAQSLDGIQNKNNEFYSTIGMDEDSLSKELDQLIVLLKEMDSKGIDIINLENNKPEQIESLSSSAKALYLKYESEIQNKGIEETIGDVSLLVGSDVVSSGKFTTAAKASGIYISNKIVEKLNDVAGWSGGIFGVAAALIKLKLGLSPTAYTMLIIAVATLGMKTINSCNKYKKGFYLKGEFVGPMFAPVGTVTCKAKK
ncbi:MULTISPECIES: hypothetical protein [Bacillus]|uniref:hypothetical protein n=1 Tax=Bacillus TaxID=1386 RepID=UPI00098BC935|nr:MULTISPECIES: hypothetical protein [Bacillus]WFA05853.1 hypothetical protein P3X63_03195 [Bacillus sp. HSf4]